MADANAMCIGRTLSRVLAYGALGLPLAFAALPIYVHVPRLYTEGAGLSLALVGGVLLAVRLVDALSDPLIGWLCDRHPVRSRLVLLALPLLALGLPGLLAPPPGAGLGWLFGMLLLVTLAYSLASIAYHAWAAELGGPEDAALRTGAVASREMFALVGVVLASALPAWLAADFTEGLARLGMCFVPLLLACAAWTLLGAPQPLPRSREVAAPGSPFAPFRQPGLLRMLAVFALNGIAAAIPASTVFFFIADVLDADAASGPLLALYFVAAALSVPGWARLAARIGRPAAWALGMALAIVAFVWAALLGAGDLFAYGVICVFAGFALGADLVLPPALLAELLRQGEHPDVRAGGVFGWWNFINKANLALAAGLALPLLGALGYRPGSDDPQALQALSMVYGLLPVALKLAALALLWRWRGHWAVDVGR